MSAMKRRARVFRGNKYNQPDFVARQLSGQSHLFTTEDQDYSKQLFIYFWEKKQIIHPLDVTTSGDAALSVYLFTVDHVLPAWTFSNEASIKFLPGSKSSSGCISRYESIKWASSTNNFVAGHSNAQSQCDDLQSTQNI
jgi:hypothetical protein